MSSNALLKDMSDNPPCRLFISLYGLNAWQTLITSVSTVMGSKQSGNTIVYRNQKLWKIITWLLCIICCFWWWNSIMWWCFISFFTSKIYDDFPSCDDFPYYDDCTSWWYELMWLLLKWPAGQWGSRQEGVQMSRKTAKKIMYIHHKRSGQNFCFSL